MIRPVHKLLAKVRKAKAVRRAREAFDAAKAAHDEAVARRDTRDQRLTSERLTQAATSLLRAEVSR